MHLFYGRLSLGTGVFLKIFLKPKDKTEKKKKKSSLKH